MRAGPVLVSFKSYLGDAVMATPILPALESEFSSVTCIAMGAVPQLLDGLVSRGRIEKIPKVRKPNEVFKQAASLRREKYAAAVLVNHSFRSALTAALAGIPIRVGHDREYRRVLLTHPVAYGESEYETKMNFDMLEAIGVPYTFRNPFLVVSSAEREFGKSSVGPRAVGVQPGARFGQKQLRPETLNFVAERLREHGFEIVLLGGPEEAKIAAEFPGAATNLVGKTSIRETIGVLSALKLMIGGDTGLMHMAAAVDCPTVTVFGPTPLEKWAHRYEPHVALQAASREIGNMTGELLWETVRELPFVR